VPEPSVRPGRVYLVGAGPGDPGLLTLRGRDCLARAEVVVYDRLVDPVLLTHAPAEAERIYAGKESDRHALPQAEINRLLVERARAGKTVVRLKGGDPFVFGRGGEEAEALVEGGITFEVVPGVTSAIAAPAYAGIPVTHRDLSSSLAIVTGHASPRDADVPPDWECLATGAGTLVFLMAVSNLPRIVERLLGQGTPPTTPVAVVERGTWPSQRTVQSTLAELVEATGEAQIEPPAVIVVGPTVALRDRLRWFDNRPLFGKRVLVTRTREQAGTLRVLLEERGAVAIELPTIQVGPPDDWGPVDRAIGRLDRFDWAIFTSVNGVRFFFERLAQRGEDVRVLKGVRLGAIGPATAAALAEQRIRVDFVPGEFVAEAIVEEMRRFELRGKRVLLPRAAEVREVLADGLTAQGAQVEDVAVYRTRPAGDPVAARGYFESGGVDVAAFTSSSTVRNLVALLGDAAQTLLSQVVIACIGPVTAAQARELGLTVQIEAAEHSIPGLVGALEEYYARG
jgi:uroporphyrinogen III methyltransferase / synthase